MWCVGLFCILAIVCVVWCIVDWNDPQNKMLREIESRNLAQIDAHRKAREREERERREWENSPEGQAHLEGVRRRVAEAERRRAAELLQEQARQRKCEEESAKAEWNAFFESQTMKAIASLSGLEFEKFLARLLSQLGYSDIRLTAINDQGGDILCTSQNCDAVVVQAKRWKGTVGNSAVQEILGGMLHYNCDVGMIITNSTFTAAARNLAAKDPRIALCDGSWLKEQVARCFPTGTPPFDRLRYEREVKPFVGSIVKRVTVVAIGLDGCAYCSKDEILAALGAGVLRVEDAVKLVADAERFSADSSGA